MKEISRLLIALTLIAACAGLVLSLVEGSPASRSKNNAVFRCSKH